MKKALFFITAAGCSLLYTPLFSQEKALCDSLGLPGDNLNLYGVLDIFQQCKTLEEFETKINAQDSKVNNIDLNGDNKIDYIKVVDNMHGTAHAIVLQDVINEKETQDLAVIEIDKDNNGKAHIQIVGDEQLYGKNYIIEPKGEEAGNTASGGTPNPGYNLRRSNTYISPDGQTTYINNYYTSENRTVAVYDDGYYADSWPLISYLYMPTYVTYVSPWYWGYYPSFWFAWTPLFWHSYYYGYYYPHYNHYCGYYHRAYGFRNSYAHNYYGQRRSSSAFVNQRREQGGYRSTYSRPDLASAGRLTNTNRLSGRSNSAIGNGRSNSEARQTSSGRNNFAGNNNVNRSERNANTANARSNSDARQTANARNNWAGNNNVNRSERNTNTANARSNSDARQTSNARNNWAGNNSVNRSSGSNRSYYSNSSSRSESGFASHGSPSAPRSSQRSSGGSGFASRSSSGGFSSHSSGGFSSQGGGSRSSFGGGGGSRSSGGGGSRSGGGGGGNRGGGGGRR